MSIRDTVLKEALEIRKAAHLDEIAKIEVELEAVGRRLAEAVHLTQAPEAAQEPAEEAPAPEPEPTPEVTPEAAPEAPAEAEPEAEAEAPAPAKTRK